MKKLLLLITFLLTLSIAVFAGCAGTKPDGKAKANENTALEQSLESEENKKFPVPRTPRINRDSTEKLTAEGENEDAPEIPEAPRLRPHKPRRHRNYPVPLPEHRPIQPKG